MILSKQTLPCVPDGPLEDSALEVISSGGVVTIVLKSTPLGVLRNGVKRALWKAIIEIVRREETRCLVLTGEGKAFSVGSDVREFQQEPEWLRSSEILEQGLNQLIQSVPVPTIAAINGFALGGGAVIALSCDIRLMSQTAALGFPEVQVGAFTSAGGTQLVPSFVGKNRALELFLTGRQVAAEEAQSLGLVEQVSAPERLMNDAIELAETIAGLPPVAVGAIKEGVLAATRGNPNGLALERELAVRVGMTGEAAEGQRAFLQKRSPRFSDG